MLTEVLLSWPMVARPVGLGGLMVNQELEEMPVKKHYVIIVVGERFEPRAYKMDWQNNTTMSVRAKIEAEYLKESETGYVFVSEGRGLIPLLTVVN